MPSTKNVLRFQSLTDLNTIAQVTARLMVRPNQKLQVALISNEMQSTTHEFKKFWSTKDAMTSTK